MSERILLAGCGDLGLRVARRLLARGDQVYALRRNPPRGSDDGIVWLRADLARPATLAQLPAGIQRLVYLPAPDARDEQTYRAVFVDGLQHLLAALDAGQLVRRLLVSSSAVYGDHQGDWVDEATPPDPPGFNGRVLLEAERRLASQAPDAVLLRLAGLYGPGRLQLVERLRQGRAVVPRARPHWANRIHVDDAAAAVVHLLHLPAPAPLYLGVDDTPLPLDVLYDALARQLGVPPPGEGAAPPTVGSKRLSNARLRASGFDLQWPDARTGYAALIGRAVPGSHAADADVTPTSL